MTYDVTLKVNALNAQLCRCRHFVSRHGAVPLMFLQSITKWRSKCELLKHLFIVIL